MSEKFSDAIEVNETEEIYNILEKKFCPECYINLEISSQSTSMHENRYYDTIMAVCPDCEREFTYIFDVTKPFNSQSKFF